MNSVSCFLPIFIICGSFVYTAFDSIQFLILCFLYFVLIACIFYSIFYVGIWQLAVLLSSRMSMDVLIGGVILVFFLGGMHDFKQSTQNVINKYFFLVPNRFLEKIMAKKKKKSHQLFQFRGRYSLGYPYRASMIFWWRFIFRSSRFSSASIW